MMHIRLSLFFFLVLALPACSARQPGLLLTVTPAAAVTAAETKPAALVTPTLTTQPLAAPTQIAPLPSVTPTEISALVLTLVAPTAGSVTPASASPEPEVPLVYQSIFRDAFDKNAKGWSLGEGMEIAQGALRMWTGSRDINAVVVPLDEHAQADVSIKIGVQVVQWDGKSSLMFGAGCRMNETSYDQYMMFVGPLGKDKAMLQMAKFKSGQLIQMTDLPHIFNLPHDITQKPVPFEFICQSQNLTIKVGTETIASLTDAEYASGSMDLFVMGADKKATVAFDQVEVSQVKNK